MKSTGNPLYRWFRQGVRNPVTRQWVILGVLVYLFSPIDIVPSFLPGFGEIDDVLLVGLLFSELWQLWLERRLNPSSATPSPENANTATDKSPTVDVSAVIVDD
ncbi:MAG: DUF1232 domain-containing protein [Cyanobacteria bacterium P01_D01_bin.123]